MEKQPKFDYSDIKFKDNGKLKLIIVVGTRPEIIRLAAVITKCRQPTPQSARCRSALTGLLSSFP